jgi:hypothetical protein
LPAVCFHKLPERFKKIMLKCARKSGLVSAWEKKLSRFGLSLHALRLTRIQCVSEAGGTGFSIAFDPALSGRHWRDGAMLKGYTFQDVQGFGRVPARAYFRDVPMWANDDRLCRQLLLHIYPDLETRSRKRAARLWRMCYCAYRLRWSDDQIGDEMKIKRQSVTEALRRLRRRAEKLFNPENGKQDACDGNEIMLDPQVTLEQHFCSNL